MAHHGNSGNAVRLRDESLEILTTGESRQTVIFDGSIGKDNLGGSILIKRNLKRRGELSGLVIITPQTGETRADRISTLADDTAPPWLLFTSDAADGLLCINF